MKRTLAGVAATTLAVGGMLVATAAPASAHTPAIHATCDSLSVDLSVYDKHVENTVTIRVGGEERVMETFGSSFHIDLPLDAKQDEHWVVDVDAGDDDGTRGWDRTVKGSRDACETAEPGEAQVGIYLYPKLRPQDRAAWVNSGEQILIGTKTLPYAEAEKLDDEYWYTALPSGDEALADVSKVLADVTVCDDWGIQQDLLRGGPDEYKMPTSITYPDGSSMDGNLMDWTHQELEELDIVLPSGEACGTPSTPPAPQDELVVPEAPVELTVCGAEPSDIELPSTEGVEYERVENRIVATPAPGYAFAEENLGNYEFEDGRAVLPVEEVIPSAEDCALVPGDIEAVCVGDTPYLDYGVALPEKFTLPEGTELSDTPLTITFIHPDDSEQNFVVTEQPLEGQLLWPGASAGEPQQWPGWERQDDGAYIETAGNYAWTREGVQVLFEVNPEYSQLVGYPEASTECANPVGVGGPDTEVVADETDVPSPAAEPVETEQPVAEAADELPQTGATVGVFAGIAALLIVGGGVLFWLRRRIQH